jgi:UDP-N-acetylmuramate--alanine ligase
MPEQPWAGRRIHIVGIGGAGMSAYALAAHALGAVVSGSDRADTPYLEPLRAAGIAIAIGHDAANVPDDAEIYHSTAIPADNPERVAVQERGLADRSRAELLGELTTLRKVIAVAGAHGKTTTSSMIAHALLEAGGDPGYLIGGSLTTTGSNAAWGSGEWLVVEADESDRSMLALDVDVAVLTNVELDHHATYASLDELERTFAAFLDGAAARVVAPGLERLTGGGVTTFAVERLELTEGGSRFEAEGVAVELVVPGEHNARNAAAALAACRLAGADIAAAARSLAGFTGAGRRFQPLGTTATGARLIDDYAHHPTEIAATIAAARTLAAKRVVAVFQPHLYSRTAHLSREFGAALAAADIACVLDVYPSRERADDFPGVSGLLIAEAAADHGAGREVLWLPRFDDAERVLRERLRDGDLCLILGAGDVDALGRRLVASP